MATSADGSGPRTATQSHPRGDVNDQLVNSSLRGYVNRHSAKVLTGFRTPLYGCLCVTDFIGPVIHGGWRAARSFIASLLTEEY